MARVAVRITGLLADIAGVERRATVEAASAAEALATLCRQVPALKVHVFDDDGEVRRHVNVFVRGDLVDPRDLDVELTDGDEMAVMQAVSGG